MSKIKYAAKQCIMIAFISCVVMLGSSNLPTISGYDTRYAELADDLLESRITNINSQIDMRLTKEVRDKIIEYTLGWRAGTEKLLGKGELYFPMFENVLAQHRLPAELKYLSVIESSLKPSATSRTGAAGLWQFMPSTARMYKLKVSRSVDERRDPMKSTEAAAKFLKDLFVEFGDWTLAIAAYNCGPGNVRKAIRKANSWDFWTIRKYLPSETRRYVPKFIAASYLMNYYNEHGLVPDQLPLDFQFTSSAKIFDKKNFKTIARESGVDLETIKKLNPSYLYNYIPQSNGRNILTLPADGMNRFMLTNYSAQIIQSALVEGIVNIRNRSLLDIVELQPKYNTNMSSAINGRYIAQEASNLINEAAITDQFEYHKLGRRETLYEYAKSRSDVSLSDILNLNGFTLNSPPRPGTIFKVKKI